MFFFTWMRERRKERLLSSDGGGQKWSVTEAQTYCYVNYQSRKLPRNPVVENIRSFLTTILLRKISVPVLSSLSFPPFPSKTFTDQSVLFYLLEPSTRHCTAWINTAGIQFQPVEGRNTPTLHAPSRFLLWRPFLLERLHETVQSFLQSRPT